MVDRSSENINLSNEERGILYVKTPVERRLFDIIERDKNKILEDLASGNFGNYFNDESKYYQDKVYPFYRELHGYFFDSNEIGAIFQSANLPDWKEKGTGSILDYLTEKIKEEKTAAKKEEDKRQPLIDRIIQLAFDNSEFIHDQYKEGFAVVNSGMNKKVIKLHSREFKLWMGKRFWDKERKGITQDVLTSALNTIEGKALFEGERVDLHNRVASHNGKIYYDMSDEEGRIIEIDNNGWRFTTNSPILFRREQHQKAQVEPKREGDLDKLWTYLNLSSDGDRVLFRSMLTSAFFPDIDHAIPVLHGQQGGGKTFTSECVKDLIDPSSLKTHALSKDEQSLILTLYHNWLTIFDNVSEVKDWQSDMLSRAVTGEGVSRRRLYTDDEEQMYNFRRNVMINGLIIPLTASDVMDRSLLFKIERFEQHGSKEKLEKEFERDKPEILGALFDLVSKTLKRIGKEDIEIPPGIRLYDFAVIGEAAARAVEEEDGHFLDLYLKKKADDNFEVIQSSLMGSVLYSLIADGTYRGAGDKYYDFLDEEEKWSGSPSELLEIFNFKAAELKIDKRAKEWKGSPKGLSNALEKLKTNFKAIGVEIERGREHEGRFIDILVNESCPLHKGKKPSQPSQPSRPDEDGDEGDEGDEKIPASKGEESGEKIKPKAPSEEKTTRTVNIDDIEKDGTIRPEAFDPDSQAKQSKEAQKRLEEENTLEEDGSLKTVIKSFVTDASKRDDRGAMVVALVNRLAIDRGYETKEVKAAIDRMIQEGELEFSQDDCGEFVKVPES